jgi:carotenoid cleavage dioxygenase-like enzyme
MPSWRHVHRGSRRPTTEQQRASLAGGGLCQHPEKNRQGLTIDQQLCWRDGYHEGYLMADHPWLVHSMSETPGTTPEASSETALMETAAAAGGSGAEQSADNGFDFSGRYEEIIGKINTTLGQVDWAQMSKFIKAGGIIFQWEPSLEQKYIVIPRGGEAKDVRVFSAPNAMPGHVVNAFDDNGKLYLDLPVALDNVFWFFPEAGGKFPPPGSFGTEVTRWCFDMNDKHSKAVPSVMSRMAAEFPHCDDRYVGRPYKYGFMQASDMSKPYNPERAGPIMGFFFNTLLTMDMSTGTATTWFAGDTSSTQEPVFAPKSASAAEGEGYVLSIVNRRAEHRSDLVILDAQRMQDGPVATVKLPVRLKYGIHGNWLPTSR